MTITAVTCTSDRPEAFAFCEGWISKQTVKPDFWLVLDDGTVPAKCTMGQQHVYIPQFRGPGSMTNKIKYAIENQLIKGDLVAVIEDDDAYMPTWLEWCAKQLKDYDLIGEGRNLYYNVRDRWWFDHGNMSHASLCATAFTKKMLPQLLRECTRSSDPWIDDRLWKNCKLPKKVFDPHVTGKRLTIGIKAMPGLKGYGSGHDRDSGWAIHDPTMAKLRELIGSDSDEYSRFHDATPHGASVPAVEVHIVAYNEELILPYTLRHYKTFASRIVVHDGGSTDRTNEICAEYGAEVHDWDTKGQINDELLRILKETCWVGTKADLVIVGDADEIVYFPHGPVKTLNAYLTTKVPVVKCKGYEMESPNLPTTTGQIYEEINHGAPDDRWYGKPCIINPKLIRSIHFTHGAHEANAELLNRRRFIPTAASTPVSLLLHYHHLGSIERIGARYDGNKSRFSAENKKHGWGWQGSGLTHSQQKRANILAKRMKVL